MPRGYDIPLLWLGWQLAAIAIVWLVRNALDVDGSVGAGVGVVGVAIVVVRLRRQLQARDEGKSR